MRLYLASTSPRRSQLLEAAGIGFELVSPGDEIQGPASLRERALARARMKAAHADLAGRPAGVVLGVDTIVVAEGVEFGKPVDAGDAGRMLQALSGRTHEVMTGHVLRAHPFVSGAEWEALACSTVRCAALAADRIAAHVAVGGWQGKAGGYGIQDAEVEFMTLVDGDLDTVIGLSIRSLRTLLARAVREVR